LGAKFSYPISASKDSVPFRPTDFFSSTLANTTALCYIVPRQAKLKKTSWKGTVMAQNAQEWIRDVLKSALDDWAQTREGKVTDIEPTATDPTPLGKVLKVKDFWPYPVDIAGDGLTRQRSQDRVELVYTVRLKVLPTVTGQIEFTVDGDTKYEATVSNILDWDKDRIKEDLMKRMSGEA
jgi:hypothetical protein